MDLKDIILKNRSYRRFYQEVGISRKDLVEMVDAARLSPSSRNIQPLKYIICNDRVVNAKIFGTVAWAGYLTDWDGPVEGERPSAYIIQMHDKEISPNYSCDHGICAQSIMLKAVEAGFGGCIIASVKRDALRAILNIDDRYDIIQLFALGKPKETVVIDPIKENEYKYWRDGENIHHVPKRSLDEILINYEESDRIII